MATGILISCAGLPSTITSLFPDNGLASLAGVLARDGHQVRILDFNTTGFVEQWVPPEVTAELRALLPSLSASPDPEVVERLLAASRRLDEAMVAAAAALTHTIAAEIEALDADFVGFKLWSGDGVTISQRVAGALRARFPRLAVFAGGPAVLLSEEQAFGDRGAFDVLVDGEGELAIAGLVRWAEGKGELTGVPNLILRDGPGFARTPRRLAPSLDALPPPLYDPEVYPALCGDEKVRLFVIDESRGCPMQCAFCTHQEASGNRWRLRSAERLQAEVSALRAAFGINSFRLSGSYTPAQAYGQLAASFGTEEPGYRFCGFSHPDGLPHDLAGLAAAGCASLFLGIESFVYADLQRLGKRGRSEHAKQAVRACIDAGIVPILSLIIPAPGQTDDAIEANFAALVELGRDGRAVVATQFPGLFPRTPWWEERERAGFSLTMPEEAYRRFLTTFKIQHAIPPSYWEPMPYTIDGRDFRAYTAINTEFQNRLAAEGVVVNVADDIVVLAQALGVPLLEFRDELRRLFFCLDAPGIRRLAARLNRVL